MTTIDDDPQQTAQPFSTDELSSIRADLTLAAERLRAELRLADEARSSMVSGSSVSTLHDDADIAAARSDLLQDAVQAENAKAILDQTEHVLARLDDGTYEACEICGAQIGRARLQAFARASLCLQCV